MVKLLNFWMRHWMKGKQHEQQESVEFELGGADI